MLSKIKETWNMLDQSIYVGERLEANLRALTIVSVATALFGIVLLVMDYTTRQGDMVIPAVVTFLCALGCGLFAGVLRNRKIAILFPVIFCAVAFTIYTLRGYADGYAILWTLMLPIGISYFVSVKYGILLSIYYFVLFVLLFYTPFWNHMAAYYPEGFITRFPLLYACMAIFTAIAMIQHHRGVLREMEYSQRLNAEVQKQTRIATERADKLELLNEEMVRSLAMTIDAKDEYTNGHSFRVARYSEVLARALGWPESEVEELKRAALLHDIGKIGVPDAVLNKPGRLTDSEFDVIRAHTTMGGDILSHSESLHKAALVARYHHERWNGSGYPEGLSGESIPAEARLVAIADSYDAMRSNRVYDKGRPEEVVREELIKGRGTQFDPGMMDVFLELLDSGEMGD